MCLIFLQGEAGSYPIENTGAGWNDQDLHERGGNIEKKPSVVAVKDFFFHLIKHCSNP